MTDAAPSAPRRDPNAFVQAWIDSLAQVLGQIHGSALPWVALEHAPPSLTKSAPDDLGPGNLWILCACSGGLRGELSLRIPAAATVRLAQLFMHEPVHEPMHEAMNEPPPPPAEATAEVAAEAAPTPAAQPTDENREAVVELLRQVAGLVATALHAAWGEVQLRLDAAPGAPSWPASSTHWLHASEDSRTLIEIHLSAALVAGLRAEKAEKTEAAVSAPAAPASPSPVSATPVPQAPVSQTPLPQTADESRAKLGLLMDVELALTLRFGSRRLLLREVLDLNPGAVVELDRKVEEPVDVLLDGRLVARGEVVVLNGNYGVRVTEVAPNSP
jgi:flagellar motor switch protein FliN